ncbi:MAG: HisS family protein, partial [Clostridia bacterium]|nr:HisS family protein [Clostridia bacterium]
MKVEPKTLPGFMELLPKDQILFNQYIDIIKDVYEKYGFLPIDTPNIELSEILLAKAGGETEKQIYRFKKGDNDLALRFDLTVPTAKFVAMYYNDIKFPFKRYQIGRVYRGEKPQQGRFREFYQTDIDIIGDGELSIINDAEIQSIMYVLFKKMNIGKFTIHMNNRKVLNGYMSYLELPDKSVEILRIIDKINKIGVQEVENEIIELGIDKDKANSILKFITINGNNSNVIEQLKKLE